MEQDNLTVEEKVCRGIFYGFLMLWIVPFWVLYGICSPKKAYVDFREMIRENDLFTWPLSR